MTVAQSTELHEILVELHDEDAEKVLSYAAFLKHVQHLEDEDDIACCLARKDEPSYSLEEVKLGLGLK